MKSVALHNLGCKVNAYETDVMRQSLEESGYRIVPFDQRADIYIVNTCTVTNIADRKSRQMLHRAKKQNPDAVVVAVGCYVQNGGRDVSEDAAVDLVVGNNRKGEIVRILEDYFAARSVCGTVIDIAGTEEYEDMRLRKISEHTRAYIKIQDGCNQFCTYCAIPLARGRVRSRRPESVLDEVRTLAEAGCREAVLTGIHLSSYGLDFLGVRSADYLDACRAGFLPELIERIAEIPGIERIRLGSLEPRIITPAFAERLSGCGKLCPHFHLSLQSGCDATLKRMNRHYDTARFEQSVALIRRCFGRAAVTTDVIVGFPGETEEEFAQTAAFLERICFYDMHVFKYSERAGTPAAAMKEQVPDAVRAARSELLIGLAERQSRAYREGCIGQPMEVLTEEYREIGGVRYAFGHTRDYVPAAVPAQDAALNELVRGTGERMLTEEIVLCGR